MKNLRQSNRRWRNVAALALFTGSLAAMLIAFALSGPAFADDGPTGCCVCNCRNQAATAGLPEPEDALCITGAELNCPAICSGRGCEPGGFEETSCSEVFVCEASFNEDSTMAPVASPLAMAAVAILLAYLGLRTLTFTKRP